jgi:phosphatidylglycerophosphate synthase
MRNFLTNLQSFLEKLDHLRDELLFIFIKPYWPRKISPNQISYLRVAIGLLLFVFLFFLGIKNKLLVLFMFFVGVLTDLFDGSVARGTNRVTEFGAMLDSTADRILILPIAVYALFQNEKWLLLALLLMEVCNALISIFYKSKEIYLESNIFGKTKMVLQSVVFIVILIIWPKAPTELFLDMLWLSIIFGILSIFSRILELKGKINEKLFKNIQHPFK